METWLDRDLLLFFTFVLAFLLEVLRFQRLGVLGLSLAWTGGWRYAYYLRFLAGLGSIGPILAVLVTWMLTLVWNWLLTALPPLAPYLAGLFAVALAGAIAFLFFKALLKVRPLRRVLPLLAVLTLLDVTCFILEPLRWLFGGTLIVLVTSALGDVLRFTSWKDVVAWLDRPPEESEAARGRDRVRLLVFTEAEGVLARRGDHLELQGEQIAGSEGDPAVALARRLLDRTRLTEVVAALEEARRQQDLLAQIPPLIARNLRSLYAYQQSLSAEEGTAEEKQGRVVERIRALLDQSLGERFRSLLYWNYDLPDEEIHLSLSRIPRVEIKPMVTAQEYMGLFLGGLQHNKQDRTGPKTKRSG